MPSKRAIIAAAAGLPLAFVGLLVAEVAFATRREYLPDDPGYVVEGLATPTGPTTGPPLRMVMLGDSTVAGLGSPTAAESLALLTAQRVADATGRQVDVRGVGVSGARTLDVRDEQLANVDAGSADVVVIVVGSNDVTHLTPPWEFGEQTRSMLDAARAKQAPVILGGIPLFGGATALAQPLRWVVDRNASILRGVQRRAATNTPGVAFVDIAVLASPRFEGVPGAMSDDGFHPGPPGYGFWADALAPAVVDVISS
jgi:lysophospholipase L1-like esterase